MNSFAPAQPHAPASAFELATGFVFGDWPEPVLPARVASPRATLEDLIRPALARPPCVVGFSGGRDSSAVLASALVLARREGWEEPIAVTLEFEHERTREREWQELVIAHLGLESWVRCRLEFELDFVGPLAAGGLRRHGVLFPANAHMVVPLAEQARGGSVLTGLGGDDTFGSWPWEDIASLLARRRPVRRGDVRRVAHALAPLGLRAEVLRRHEPLALPWIRAEFRRDAGRRMALELSRAPRLWAPRMLWSASWRPWRAAARSLEVLGHDHGVAVHSPFLDPAFFTALARAGGLFGWGDRTETMRALFADLLPESLITRQGKAEFGAPLFGAHTRAFAQAWDGRAGLDEHLVDADTLRAVWMSDRPHAQAATPLQAAWVASRPSPD